MLCHESRDGYASRRWMGTGIAERRLPCTPSALPRSIGCPSFSLAIHYHTLCDLSTVILRFLQFSFRVAYATHFCAAVRPIPSRPPDATPRRTHPPRPLRSCRLLTDSDAGRGLHFHRRHEDGHRCSHPITTSRPIFTTSRQLTIKPRKPLKTLRFSRVTNRSLYCLSSNTRDPAHYTTADATLKSVRYSIRAAHTYEETRVTALYTLPSDLVDVARSS